WAAGLAGDTARAEQHFLIADQLEFEDGAGGNHLYSNRGVWWAEWLARTGRRWAARLLTEDNEALCYDNGWAGPLARCECLRGHSVRPGDDAVAEAGASLGPAAPSQRGGDCLPDLAGTLPALAEWAVAAGDPDAARGYLDEAIAVAASCGLVPAQCAAL